MLVLLDTVLLVLQTCYAIFIEGMVLRPPGCFCIVFVG